MSVTDSHEAGRKGRKEVDRDVSTVRALRCVTHQVREQEAVAVFHVLVHDTAEHLLALHNERREWHLVVNNEGAGIRKLAMSDMRKAGK